MNFFYLTLLLHSIWSCNAEDLKVSIYYETLCPDSIRFITDQLFPSYKNIGSALHLDFIPFGRAISNNATGKWIFECQHGPSECYGNEIHSCAVGIYSSRESAEFIYCSMVSGHPSSKLVLAKCAENNGLSWPTLNKCYESGQGDKMMALNGERTNALKDIPFIPAIAFNDNYNLSIQHDAVHDFFHTACKLMDESPNGCQNGFNYNSIELIRLK